MPAHPSPAVQATRIVAVASLLALMALGLAWELWLAPLRPGGSWLALKVLPLALALPGLLRYRMQTCRGLALFVWLYFVEGVVRATSDHGVSARCALAQVALVLLLFAACAAQVRLRQRAARAAAAGPAVSH
ncbi:MAG TPA: DUF2069 domain-containing protein [Ottowia sp.]|nr:DUF2069 domain-containing protein [Burkholderiales bacterium]HNI85651.1 DUF2069 domain-containing protein [Ottowia sp.]